jgi:hypothetical protein
MYMESICCISLRMSRHQFDLNSAVASHIDCSFVHFRTVFEFACLLQGRIGKMQTGPSMKKDVLAVTAAACR